MKEKELFIQSGILERHVMGDTSYDEAAEIAQMAAAYPEIQQELKQIEEALGSYAHAIEMNTPSSLRSKVLAQFEEKKYPSLAEIKSLPSLGENANYDFWQTITQAIPNPSEAPLGQLYPLKAEPDKLTCVIWTSDKILEEHHDDLIEKFLILEGSCDCIIDGVVNHMKPGDYMEIPLHAPHHIQVTSNHMVKGILQRARLIA
jgi:mannose-6-phosphate isomerase-like protein (cupin superfamily)